MKIYNRLLDEWLQLSRWLLENHKKSERRIIYRLFSLLEGLFVRRDETKRQFSIWVILNPGLPSHLFKQVYNI